MFDALGGLVGGYFQNQAARSRGKVDEAMSRLSLAGAVRNRRMAEMNARQNQRHAEESAAQSGVYDPDEAMNVGVQAINRVKAKDAIELEGAHDSERAANMHLRAVREGIKRQRQSYYANMALHLLGAGMGAYSMWPSQAGQMPDLAAQGMSQGTGLPAWMFTTGQQPTPQRYGR